MLSSSFINLLKYKTNGFLNIIIYSNKKELFFQLTNKKLHKLTFSGIIHKNFKKGGSISMEKIKFKEIDLSTLHKLQSQGTQSTIYTDGIIGYKFLDGLFPYEKRELYKKFLDMDGIKIDGVILPQSLIIEEGTLRGYTMKYFANSMPLSDKFLKRYFNCNELLVYTEKASRILRNIHNNGIIYQDLSFENILIDNFGNIAFCDIDGCTYKRHTSPFISMLLKEFLIDYRHSKVFINKDLDKLSMILSFYLIMYGESLERITKRQYNILSNKIQTLKNLRNIANTLINKSNSIPALPYMDEVIDLSDDYVVDRKKILTMKQRMF